jgi:hypothetical protein
MARTKGIQVYPDSNNFMRQAHQISRSAYLLPGVQKRILAILIAQVQIRDNGFELLEVNAGDLLRSLEVADSHYAFVRDHMKALKGAIIEYVKSRDVYKFKLNEDLQPFILGLKAHWATIKITDLNKLTGKYAHRIYDLIMAGKGFAGTGGNRPGEWFVDLEFDNLRVIFKVNPNEYKATNDFRKKVLDAPIQEINKAGIGIKIATDYDRFRHGRTLSGVRLLVKSTLPGEPKNVTPTPAETEDDLLKEAHRVRFEELVALELAQKPLPGFESSDPRWAAELAALNTLKKELATSKTKPSKKKKAKPEDEVYSAEALLSGKGIRT